MKNQPQFNVGVDRPATPPKDLITKTQVDNVDGFVTVKISDKSGYEWGMGGEAGLVVAINKGHAEVDIIGSEENIEFLLATALIKARKLMGEKVVDTAIAHYISRVQKGQL